VVTPAIGMPLCERGEPLDVLCGEPGKLVPQLVWLPAQSIVVMNQGTL
jgi:hypothetical protein